MSDEIGIHDDMDKPIRMAVSVTAKRVEHYGDVVDAMARSAIDRYVKKTSQQPTENQIAYLKADLVRLMVIGRDVLGAQKVDIT